jgi:hypothetical protein
MWQNVAGRPRSVVRRYRRSARCGGGRWDRLGLGCCAMSEGELLIGDGVTQGIVRIGGYGAPAAAAVQPDGAGVPGPSARCGFTGAPLPLGLDEQGREVLSYVPGDVPRSRDRAPAFAHADIPHRVAVFADAYGMKERHRAELAPSRSTWRAAITRTRATRQSRTRCSASSGRTAPRTSCRAPRRGCATPPPRSPLASASRVRPVGRWPHPDARISNAGRTHLPPVSCGANTS